MRIKRSLKKGINVITAVGCIIYAAFQGGMEEEKKKKVKSLRPSDFKFSETASRSKQRRNGRGFARWMDDWMSGWLDWQIEKQTQRKNKQISGA